jgi:predicted transcriptional regulator
VKVHVGKQLEDAVRASEWSITALAQKLKLSRKTIYNYFENPDLDEFIVKRFENVLHVYILPIQNEGNLGNSSAANHSENPAEHSAQFWKNKYLELLEKYSQLLEKMA